MVLTGLMIGVGLPVLFMVFEIQAAMTLWGFDAMWLAALAIMIFDFVLARMFWRRAIALEQSAGRVNEYGRALRRWRRLRGVKQSHAAELLGVTQATLSRWERGHHRLPEAAERKLSHLLRAPLNSAGDAGLRRLVEGSALLRPSDLRSLAPPSRRLAPRVINWTADLAEMRGQSLWRFATDEIRAAESRLGELGWYDDGVAQVSFRERRQRQRDRADRAGHAGMGAPAAQRRHPGPAGDVAHSAPSRAVGPPEPAS